MIKKKWLGMLLSILGFELLGFISGLLSGNIASIYAALQKPPLSPPGQVFGIVWIVLYACMGVAFYLIISNSQKDKNNGLHWFLFQFILNLLWPILFFRFGLHWAALTAIVIMDILMLFVLKYFYRINKASSSILIPYLLWILFATYLNIGVALLN